MSKVDIISGFLGAGKTTLIKKLIKEAFNNEQIVLIENEFGEIGIDGSFLKEAGITINEMNSGCICCSLVGDFEEALKQVIDQYHPDRIIIEPSGVGKLSDVIKAVQDVDSDEIVLNSFITVVDAKKCRIYTKNFGEFFNNQIEHASTIILSRTQDINEDKLKECVNIIKQTNDKAHIITTPWEELTGETILNTIEDKNSLKDILLHEEEICPVCGHHHEHHHHHDEECECGHHHEHHHHHDEECECGHHHEHHHHDEECECGHHHEHHHHDEECSCGHHHEHHHHDEDCGCGHHHHHADEVFTSFGYETPLTYSKERIEDILKALSTDDYGVILRAKGILKSVNGWLEFDFVPEEYEIRDASADYTGRVCVIGQNLDEDKLKELFGD
ncbi:MAG: GTP-binding protein [Bacilli bacterium]|nr:GTP-binding protein [Bacilli bacterium]